MSCQVHFPCVPAISGSHDDESVDGQSVALVDFQSSNHTGSFRGPPFEGETTEQCDRFSLRSCPCENPPPSAGGHHTGRRTSSSTPEDP